MNNIAFVDGQNLYMGTKSSNPVWEVNLSRFRIYLRDKYKVDRAYYFLGYTQDRNKKLYENIQESGFILMFREHNSEMLGKKKGNVNTEIVFQIMKKLYEKEDFNKIVLVSGDGDYKMLVDFLISKNRFEKILFPNRKFASSLYKQMSREHFSFLEDESLKIKID